MTLSVPLPVPSCTQVSSVILLPYRIPRRHVSWHSYRKNYRMLCGPSRLVWFATGSVATYAWMRHHHGHPGSFWPRASSTNTVPVPSESATTPLRSLLLPAHRHRLPPTTPSGRGLESGASRSKAAKAKEVPRIPVPRT